MTHWNQVFVFEIKRQFARKAYLFLTFGVPILALLAFGVYRTYQSNRDDAPAKKQELITDTNNQKVGYVDATTQQLFPAPESYGRPDSRTCNFDPNAPFTPGTIKRVTQPQCFTGRITYYADLAAGKAALEDKTIHVLYVVEPNYLQEGEVSVYTKEFNLSAADNSGLFTDFLLSSMLQEAAGPTYDLLYLRLRQPSVVTEHRIAESGSTAQNEGQNFVVAYVTAILLGMTLFWGGGYLMQSVVQEKESRIIEILLSSVPARALLIGKILAMGFVSVVQVTMLMGTAMLIGRQAGSLADSLNDVEIGLGKIGLIAIYFVLGYLLFGGLMAAIGAMNTTSREAQNYTAAITLPAISPMFVLSLFVEEPSSAIPTALSLFPMTAPIAMMMRVAVSDVPAWQILLSMGGMVIVIIGVLWLAGKLFGVQSLLTLENALKLKDLPKVLRSKA
ncbi:MAG: ABC transporter permease [Chloroflexi bacterium]|nr:ABC transporter permease [Chloroflexota bacterium]